MNRRSFLTKTAAAIFGFSILPPATTYSRVWRATTEIKKPAFWYQTILISRCFDQGYLDAMDKIAAQYGDGVRKIVFPHA